MDILNNISWATVAEWVAWLAPFVIALLSAKGYVNAAKMTRAVVAGVERGSEALANGEPDENGDEVAPEKQVKRAIADASEKAGVGDALDKLVQKLTKK